MNSLTRFMALTLLLIGINQNVHAQWDHNQGHGINNLSWQENMTDYKIQVRVNAKPTNVVKFRWTVFHEWSNPYSVYEIPAGMTAQQYANSFANSYFGAPQVIETYWTDPAPTPWDTVAVVDTYDEAVDLWHEINDRTENTLEIQIVPFIAGFSQGTTLTFPNLSSNNTASSTSLWDYYYDYKVNYEVWRGGQCYIIDTGSSAILKTFKSYADYQTYMAANPGYDLVESLVYHGGFSDLYSVLIAETMDEAEEMADFIESQSLLYGSGQANAPIQLFWNP